MESVHIVHFYGYPCCIWPVYTWGKEWSHTWWETKECLQQEQRDLLLKPSSLRVGWAANQPFPLSSLFGMGNPAPATVLPESGFCVQEKEMWIIDFVQTNEDYPNENKQVTHPEHGCQLLSLTFGQLKGRREVGNFYLTKGKISKTLDRRLLARGSQIG